MITKTSTSKKASHLAPVGEEWVRPADWLSLPTVNSGDQKLVGLVAVYPGDSNWLHVQATGAYTVDWGDGSSPQNIATNTTSNHNYTYASVSGTDCTRGYRQAVVTITPQAGQNLLTLNLASSTRPTGMVSGWSSSWLDIKMASANLTSLIVSSTATRAAMVERFEFVGPSAITSLVPAFSNARSLQEIVGTAWTSGVTSFASMFSTCSSLRTIPLLDTGAGLSFASMFAACQSLEEIPLLNTSAGTDFSGMFQTCSALQSVPALNTAAGTNFNTMFNSCTILQTIPLLNTAAGTNFTSMFGTCNSLQSVPALSVAAGTDFTSIFLNCMSLQSAPLAGTSRSISYASAKLKGTALDAIYTGLATVNTNLLSANASSVETSAVDWATNVVNCAVTASGTLSLDGFQALRLSSTASGEATAAITTRLAVSASTAYTFMATVGMTAAATRTCRVKITWHDAGGAPISTSAGTDSTSSANIWKQYLVQATSPVGATTASVVVSFTATSVSDVTYWDRMGLFPGTVTAWSIGGAQTITVTSNWDVANDTPSIATAKGWTVTGS